MIFLVLIEPDRGRIAVNRKELNPFTSRLRLLRHEIGFVFQLHNLTVAAGLDRKAAMARLRELTNRTRLSPRLNSKIQKLSGGERQRTTLCRALMNKPRILLADEPTGSLDEAMSATVFDLLLEIVAKEEVTLVMATHDCALAARCGRLIGMRDGRIDEPV